jgi:hypothetical protein
MLTSLIFAALFSLFIPNIKDDYPIIGIYQDVYKDIKRDLKNNKADEKALKEEFKLIKDDAFGYVKKMSVLNNNLAAVDANYNSTIEDYRNALNAIEVTADSLILLGIKSHTLLSNELTEEQWNSTFSKFDNYIKKLDAVHNNLIDW